MKKNIKAVAVYSLAFCMLLTVPACGSNKNNNSNETTKTKDVTNADGMQKYVIQLSKDNYEQYFDVTFSLRNSMHNTIITFKGCVYNGIYDDCTVTYNYAQYSGETSSLSDTFKLNLGGNGSVESKGCNEIITAVTGTVTYWK